MGDGGMNLGQIEVRVLVRDLLWGLSSFVECDDLVNRDSGAFYPQTPATDVWRAGQTGGRTRTGPTSLMAMLMGYIRWVDTKPGGQTLDGLPPSGQQGTLAHPSTWR